MGGEGEEPAIDPVDDSASASDTKISTPAPARNSLASWAKFARWGVANPVTALTVAGVILYGFLRLSASLVYQKLGFTPDEVGLGYASTLGRAIYGLTGFVLVYSLSAILVIPLAEWTGVQLARVWAGLTKKERLGEWARNRPHGRVRRSAENFMENGIVSLVLLLAILSVLGPTTFGGEETPFDGYPSRPSWKTAFSWTAEPARLHPLNAAVPFEDGQCVLYLGQADGIVALFDPVTHASWRIPTSSLTVQTGGELDRVERVPEDCPNLDSA